MDEVNKHGQAIGRKGLESRQRLLDAARQLIADEPAHKLTASAVARAAQLASQTFYLYFADIDEILLTLSREASEDMSQVHEALSAPWTSQSPASHARRFIEAFSAYWDRHRAVLSVRNYLADSGHEAFTRLREEAALPLIELLADRIMAGHADGTVVDRRAAFSRSLVIYSAIERMAVRASIIQAQPRILSLKELQEAEIAILELLFTMDPPASTR